MNFSKKSGKKKAAVAAVVCFVAAIAITGTYTFNDYKKSQNEKEIAKAEEDFTKEEILDEAVDGEIVSNEAEDPADEAEEELDFPMDENDGDTSEKDTESLENQSGYKDDVVKETSASHAVNVSFSSDSRILWPVSGVLLMDYSMEQTTYFKTLDQYKYNPAIVIAAAENDVVMAGAAGLVKSIDESAQTGLTVNIDFGNGYEAFYGQLQKVAVKTGDYVEATTTLGYVAEPTKYYSSEGTNLYFEMRKDGQPVDPKEYLVDYAE